MARESFKERLAESAKELEIPCPFKAPADTSQEPTRLHVRLLRARNLPAVDKSLMGKASSDPLASFAVVPESVLKTDGAPGRQASEVRKKSLSPEWNQDFSFEADDPAAALLCVIDDYDLVGSNDFMGLCSIPLAGLASGRAVWHLLGARRG